MPRKRPTVLTVMGILNIVFGSLGLVCDLCMGLGILLVVGAPGGGGAFQGRDNPFAEIGKQLAVVQGEVPYHTAVQVGQVVVGFFTSILLLVAGIGLLKIRNWGRMLSIAYSVVAILVTLANAIYTMAIVNPAVERLMLRQQGMDTSAFNNIGAILGAVIGMTYPIILLIMMLLPSVAAACAGHRPETFDQDREDEDDLGRERRPREEWRE